MTMDDMDEGITVSSTTYFLGNEHILLDIGTIEPLAKIQFAELAYFLSYIW